MVSALHCHRVVARVQGGRTQPPRCPEAIHGDHRNAAKDIIAFMQKIYEDPTAAGRAFYDRHRERLKAERRAFRAANADRINAQRRAAYHASETAKEKVWAGNLRVKYGITPERYKKLWEEQCGCCAVCKRTLVREKKGDTRACVDHCHDSLKIRGLLCHRCNIFLGLLDNRQLTEDALAYQLKATRER